MSDVAHVHGPVDYLIIEFEAARANGSMVEAVLDLVDRGIIRLYDVVVIQKDADGTFSGVELSDLAQDHLGGIAAFAGARSGLLGDDDLAEAANAVAPARPLPCWSTRTRGRSPSSPRPTRWVPRSWPAAASPPPTS